MNSANCAGGALAWVNDLVAQITEDGAMAKAATSNVVSMKPHQAQLNMDRKFIGLMEKHVATDADFVQPIPQTTFDRMSRIDERLAAVEERLHQEEM